MSKDYRQIFPPAGRLMFDGGKNNKFGRAIIGDNESPDCANVAFTNGAVETRGGITKLNTTAVGSFACDGIYTRRSNTGAESMVAFFGGAMYTWTGSTMTSLPSATSVFTAGVRVAGTQYQNHLFVSNGNVIPYKYGGTDFTRHGVYPPASAPSAVSGGAGNLAGVYSWKIVNVNSFSVESDGGPAVTFTVTSTGGQAVLSGIVTAAQSWGVAARNIYRTDAGGATYKRIATISDNTTTSYTDNIASSAAGVTMPTDNGVPPKFNACIYHANRIFMNDSTEPNLVWYSELDEPYTVQTAANFDLFGDDATDIVKGFAVYDNSLVVFCENSEWLWYMESTSPTDWRKIQVRSSYGSRSPFAGVRYENKVLFPAMQNSKIVGFAAISGDSVAPSATLLTVSAAGSDLQSDRIEPDIFEIQEAYVGNISACVFKNKVYIAVTYGANNTQNNRVYVLDFGISNLNRKNPAWVPYITVNAAQFTVYDGKLYYGSSIADGFIHQLETTTTNDNSAAIDSYFWTKEFSGNKGHENFEKDFRFVDLLVDKSGAYYMNLTYRVDSDKGAGTTVQINLDPGSSVWNTLIWGIGDWGGGADQEEATVSLGQVRGKRIQLKFSNQNVAGQKFKVYGAKIHYNIRGQR
jgi:hypothetical protein